MAIPIDGVTHPCATESQNGHAKGEALRQECYEAILAGRRYAGSVMKTNNHWSGEVRSNVTITAEYVFLWHYLQLDLDHDREDLIKWLTTEQREDGSWAIDDVHPGDLSVSIEAYLALKLLGVSIQLPFMEKAQEFILAKGGVPGARVFTRIYLAMFGLLPWESVPQLAPELILMPNSSPLSIYRFSSWARSTLVPLLVIAARTPVFALPNCKSSNNDYLDELWQNEEQKIIPYSPPYLSLLKEQNWVGLGAKVADAFMFHQTRWGLFTGIRTYAIKQCMEWIFARQEPSGDWAGIFPPLHASIMAMYIEGVRKDDPRMLRALQAVQRFGVRDSRGLRFQPCVSAGWDTPLMSVGLLDSCPTDDPDFAKTHAQVGKALHWMKGKQTVGCMGDWRIYKPFINSGGFAFEYNNAWYPDIDDTQASIIAFIKHNPDSIAEESVIAAIEWILGMQCMNGGWAGFDCDNDYLFLNDIPFSDMGAFCDPPTADVTGGVIEAFGLILITCSHNYRHSARLATIFDRMEAAAAKAIHFIISKQESDGSWWGRWGVNYMYGTSNVLCGLAHFHGRKGYEALDGVVARGLAFLRRWQNDDGGWGESTLSYNASKKTQEYVRTDSTPAQTAWGAMALLAFCGPNDAAVLRGVRHLIRSQTDTKEENNLRLPGRSWPEQHYTATGFPGHMMLGYEHYRHYWPMMALGRFHSQSKGYAKLSA